jgi:hypothetical protein
MNIQEVKLREFTKEEALDCMQKDFIQVDEEFYAISKLSISVWIEKVIIDEDGNKEDDVDFIYFFPKKYQEEYNLIIEKLKDSERQRQELREELSK